MNKVMGDVEAALLENPGLGMFFLPAMFAL